MFAITVIMLILLFIQAPSLVLQKQWWDLAVFLFFWGVAFVYALLVTARVNIPSPSIIIITIMEFIYSLSNYFAVL